MKTINHILQAMFLILALASAKETYAADYKIEAEKGKMNDCTIITDSKYSGRKAVRMTEGDASLTISVDIEESLRYKVIVMADGIGGEKTVNCSVNGNSVEFKTYNLEEVEVGSFKLNAGTATITITPSWTWFDIDYVRLETDNDAVQFNISAMPVTSDATDEAKLLYSFLYDNFGKRTISGISSGSFDNISLKTNTNVKTLEELTNVYKSSGRYPALVSFDFLNTTGDGVDAGNPWCTEVTNKAMALARDLWKKGGIPDFCWHWRDPSRATGEFYTSKTSFDFTEAMNADSTWNTSSAIYKNMVRDIDTVANYFLAMQKEGMACIFRPLHEAAGGWFWWGAKGSGAYRRLYHLIYDELVNVKGVHNLIWDWNADYTQTEWCPGEEYFDIVSVDIYNDAYDYSCNAAAFDKLKAATGGRKMIAMAEIGPIPDIDNEEDNDAMWSWWMVWNGDWYSKTTTEEWTKCMSDSRVITLEDMPGWTQASGIIATRPSSTSNENAVYNIMGQRVNNATHGIYIINGKKVLR